MTACIELREMLDGSLAIVIHPYDYEGLAKVLRPIFEVRKKEFKAYQSCVLESFSIDRPTKTLRFLYDGVVSGY